MRAGSPWIKAESPERSRTTECHILLPAEGAGEDRRYGRKAAGVGEGRSGRRRRRKEGGESREGGVGELSQKAAGNLPLSIQSEEGRKERQRVLVGREE